MRKSSNISFYLFFRIKFYERYFIGTSFKIGKVHDRGCENQNERHFATKMLQLCAMGRTERFLNSNDLTDTELEKKSSLRDCAGSLWQALSIDYSTPRSFANFKEDSTMYIIILTFFNWYQLQLKKLTWVLAKISKNYWFFCFFWI